MERNASKPSPPSASLHVLHKNTLDSDAISRSPNLPKYQVIRDQLMKLIRSGELPPGCRLPTERELSERFDVTRMTVRQAITQLVRGGLVVNRRPLGNFVAQTLPEGVGHRHVNLVCIGNESAHAAMFIEHGVEALRARNIEARVLRLHPGSEHLALDWVRGPMPTMLIGGIGPVRSELHRAIREAGDRVVLVGTRLDHAGICSVIGDDPLGIRLALAHLHKHGHERIALVGSVVGEHNPRMELQVQLWRQAMTEMGLARGTMDKHMIRLQAVPAGGAAMSAKLAVERYYATQRVRATGIISLSEESAVGVLSALHGLGVAVPKDVSVIAYAANLGASLCVPPLTSVDIDVDRHLKLALDRIEEMLEPDDAEPAASLLDVVTPTLIERGSVCSRR